MIDNKQKLRKMDNIDRILNLKNEILESRHHVSIIGLNGGRKSAYRIDGRSNEPIELLRKMYVKATSTFIKNVIAEIGKAKFYTEKQINMVCDHFINNDIEL